MFLNNPFNKFLNIISFFVYFFVISNIFIQTTHQFQIMFNFYIKKIKIY